MSQGHVTTVAVDTDARTIDLLFNRRSKWGSNGSKAEFGQIVLKPALRAAQSKGHPCPPGVDWIKLWESDGQSFYGQFGYRLKCKGWLPDQLLLPSARRVALGVLAAHINENKDHPTVYFQVDGEITEKFPS